MRCCQPSEMKRLAAAVLAILCCMGHNGGCHPDKGAPLASPAHALALVLETDGELELALVLASTAASPPSHVDGATALSVVSPGGETWPLVAVGGGAYRAAVAAAFEEGAPYTFHYALDDAAAEASHAFPGTFAIEAHGFADAPRAWLEEEARAGQPLRLGWSPAGLHALVEVWNAEGERTASTLDWSSPAIDADTWRAMPNDGAVELDALPVPGDYRVRLCAVEVVRRDDAPGPGTQHAVGGFGEDLGWLSGAVAGRCTVLELSVE
jgi:hypothetical protein